MRLRSLIVAVTLVAAAATAAWSGPFEDAAAANKRGDEKAYLQILQPLAESGDVRAQVWIGNLYYARRFPGRQGAEAAKWYRLAAEQGDVASQYRLGYMYLHREGLPFDQVAAAKWFQRAADQGNGAAQYELYRMYADGAGMPPDYVKAYMYLRLIMTYSNYTGDRGGRWRSSGGRSELRILARSMTAAQIAEAERLASEWKPKPER